MPTYQIHKKWFKTSSMSGFASISLWTEASKFIIDIGSLANSELKSSTVAYVPSGEFLSYLYYTIHPNKGVFDQDTFVYYGGGINKNSDKTLPFVSRIFKISPKDTENVNSDKFDKKIYIWKCGLFEANQNAQGGYVPDFKKGLSSDSIQLSLAEHYQIYLKSHAVWLRTLDLNSLLDEKKTTPNDE